MGQKLVVGPLNKGLRNDVTAFNIDNDSFPTLINAYQWRGRVKRKRGTSLLGRLQRYIGTTNGAGTLVVTILPVPIQTGVVSFAVGTDVFIDPGTTADPGTQTLITNSTTGTGTLNRVTGVLTITTSKLNTDVIYYPRQPVLGLEDFVLATNAFPGTIAFDINYAYNISTSDPYAITNISFYKNASTDVTNLPGYAAKTTWTPIWWNGQDYQQFWTVNYAGALWATNGIETPFDTTNIGMPFYGPTTTPALTAAAQVSATTVDFTVAGNNLVVGDFVFANEFVGGSGLNFQSGYVTTAGNTFRVTFPFATIAAGAYTPGILQLLTTQNSTTADLAKDCIRWYDGDPTTGVVPTAFSTGKGWVNYCPPLSQAIYSISNLPAAIYYLVGARIIVPFKDRLLFLGPVVQSSSGSPIYLQDTVIYSQNGTPYYTASYTNTPSAVIDTPVSATNVFHSILVPINQTSTSPAMFEDQTGFGGFISAGVDERLNTVSTSRDALIMGFDTLQIRFIFTGNDISPFEFYLINSELGSSSTFSAINVDKGVITRGSRGFLLTGQTECVRIDSEIPDEVFEFNLQNNGVERVCSQRDYINEWIYFTYPGDQNSFKFPNQTLLYNYRDVSWALIYEAYTTYGSFRRQSGFIWSTVGNTYPTWADWNDPWSAGTSNLFQQEVISGNQQGFILFRDEGTGEGNSLYIQNIAASVITSPDHVLSDDDFIIITGCLGTVGSQVNGKIFKVTNSTQNTFTINPLIASGTYLGGGFITRLYVPYIQTKQFPIAWDMARKTRIGVQQYLLTTTEVGQIALLIFLSQNSSDPYNDGPIVPDLNSQNDSLIYSTVLYTCPESTNLGLTPANINLQSTTAVQQQQTWHRMNTSLIGDTIQIGFTISEDQMFTYTNVNDPSTITAASQATQCVLTCNNEFSVGDLIKITGVLGMTQLNFVESSYNYYQVVSANSTSVTLLVDSTAFTAYISGGIAQRVGLLLQNSEIELHRFIMDISPSQVLA